MPNTSVEVTGGPLSRFLTVLGASVVGLALALVLAEFFLRIVRPGMVPKVGAGNLVLDQNLGWTRVPSFASHADERATHRVYFIGDSFTDDDKWPEIAQQAASASEVYFSAHVGGVAGYGTTQATLKLTRDLEAVKPDLVVLLFYAWNDVRDNIEAPYIFYNTWTTARPYSLRASENLDMPNVTLASSALYALTLHAVGTLLPSVWGVERLAAGGRRWPVSYGTAESWRPFYRQDSQSAYVASGWQATKTALAGLQDLLEKNGIKLLLVGLDNAFTVDSDVRDIWMPEAGTADLAAPLRTLEEISVRLKIPFLNAVPSLVAEAHRSNEKMYEGPPGNLQAHLSPIGEGVLGRLVAQHIAPILNQ